MRIARSWRALVLPIAAVLSCASASAQQPPTGPTSQSTTPAGGTYRLVGTSSGQMSLEWSVARATAVVRGSLANSPTGPRLVVRDVLHGPVRIDDELLVRQPGLPTPRGWSYPDVLMCLQRQEKGDWLRLWVSRMDVPGGVMDMGFNTLTAPPDILAAVRAALREPPATFWWTMPVPANRVTGTVRALVVPVDARLERLGRQWAQSDDAHLRLVSVEALRHFPPERNASLIDALRRDDGIVAWRPGEAGKWRSGRYAVREAAYLAFGPWDTRAPPVLEGPMLRYESPGIAGLAWVTSRFFGCAVLAAICILVVGRQSCGVRITSRSVVAGAAAWSCLLLLVYVCFLWHASATHVHEFMFDSGNTHHELASYRGGLQWVWAGDWEHPGPPRYGVFRFSRYSDLWSIQSLNPGWKREKWGFGMARGVAAGPSGTTVQARFWRAPHWLAVAIFAIPPLLWLRAALRAIRRHRAGLCLACGYDLRAGHERCPECGLMAGGRAAGRP